MARHFAQDTRGARGALGDAPARGGQARRGPSPVPAVLLALLVGFFAVCGAQLHAYDAVDWRSPLTWCAMLGVAAVASVLLTLLFRLLDRMVSPIMARPVGERDRLLRRRVLVAGVAVMALCWLVVWLAAWPGFFCYDTWAFNSRLETGRLNAQQSVLHTLLVTTVLQGAHALLGSWNAAVAVYTLVQGAVVAGSAAWALVRLERAGAPLPFLVCGIAYFSLNPFIVMFGLCSTKDTLFAVWTLLLVMELAGLRGGAGGKGGGMLAASGRKRDGILAAARCAVLVFLMGAYRNNAPYVLAVALVALAVVAVARRGRSVALAAGTAVGLACYLAWTGPIAAALGVVRPSSVGEMISVPAANVAYMASLGEAEPLPEGLSELDLQAMADGWELCRQNTDNYRNVATPLLEAGATGEFVLYWLDCVAAHPGLALDSALILTQPAWDPTVESTSYNFPGHPSYGETQTSVFACLAEDPAHTDSKLPALYDLLWSISRDADYGGRPWLAALGSPASLMWLTLACLAYAAARRNARGVAAAGLLALLSATLLLGPTVLPRYYWFLYLCAPVTVWVSLAGGRGGAGCRERGGDAGETR